MHLDSIEMAGWKTFKNHTVIGHLSQGCNTIVGPNGTGKSNILDAITFVLGQSTKQNMRIGRNYDELICANGDANINEARITLKFRVHDPKAFLLPPDQHELILSRIIQRGKGTKFYVNGKMNKQSKVEELLGYMQLSIENPQFIVKQGEVAKVANKQPRELLDMIEETVGTGCYVKTKAQYFQSFEQSEKTRNEIKENITTMIEPEMEEIKRKKSLITLWDQKRDYVSKVLYKVFPYRYLKLVEERQEFLEKQQSKRDSIEIEKQLLERLDQENEGKAKRIEELEKKAKETDKLRAEIVADEKLLEVKNHGYELEKKKHDQFVKEWNRAKSDIHELKIQHSEQERIENQLSENIQKQQINLGVEENRLELLKSSKEDNFHVKQSQELQKQLVSLKGEEEIMKNRESSLVSEIGSLEKYQNQSLKRIQNKKQDISRLKAEISELEKVKAPLRVESIDFNYEISKESSLMNEINRIDNRGELSLIYKDPIPNFDRKKVFGKAIECFTVENQMYFKALEIGTSKAKLLYVVVKDNDTSKLLLDKGTFSRATTLIPNNNIESQQVSERCRANVAKVAQQYNGFAAVASDLVKFKPQLASTIRFLFGGFVVTSSFQISRAIAESSSPQLQIKCVTFDGQIIDPVGTMTGGSMNNFESILAKAAKIGELKQQISQLKGASKEKNQKFQEYNRQLQQYNRTVRDLDRKRKELESVQEQIHREKKEFNEKDKKEELESVKERRREIGKEMKVVQGKIEDIRNGKGNLQGEIESLSGHIKQLAKKIEDIKQKKYDCILGREELEHKIYQCTDIIEDTKKMKRFQESLAETLEEMESLKGEIIKNKTKYNQLFGDHLNQELMEAKELFGNDQKRREELRRLVREFEQKIENKRPEKNQILINLEKELSSLTQENPWIKEYVRENQLTLQAYPQDYNFEKEMNHYLEVEAEFKDIDTLTELYKNQDFSSIEESYHQLLKKMRILEENRSDYLTYMKYLDEKRVESISIAYKIIRDNFRKIFNFLMPHLECDLLCQNQRDILEGFRITLTNKSNKQKFYDTSLSGGQKTILSLSFVFALLLYRPCPFYLLDEVDAALDQINAQKIGLMVVFFFPKSQFIVISHRKYFSKLSQLIYQVSYVNNEGTVIKRIQNNEYDKNDVNDKHQEFVKQIEEEMQKLNSMEDGNEEKEKEKERRKGKGREKERGG